MGCNINLDSTSFQSAKTLVSIKLMHMIRKAN